MANISNQLRLKEKEPKGGFFKGLHDHIAKEIKKKATHNKRLHRIAEEIPGILFEEKGPILSVHY